MRLPIRMRAIGLIAALLLLPCLIPAEAASFGRTTAGTIPSGGLREDFKRGSKFVLSEAGEMSNICAYLDSNGGGTGYQPLALVLYRDQNGIPANKVIATGDQQIEAQQPAGWRCFPTYKALLEPGTYWIMIHSGGPTGIIRYYYDGPANWYGNADEFGDGASDAFGSGAAGEGTLSLRVDYVPLRSAGATIVGTRVSSPMSANMKRGSSFELTEEAHVWKLNAYIDGLGGATGSQPLRIALYDDANGEPAALIASGQVEPAAVAAGSAAHWVSVWVGVGPTPVLLTPGRYWIVLHTGGPTGVLR